MVEYKSIRKSIRNALIYTVVILLGLLCLLPLWNVVCISFSSRLAVDGNHVGLWPVGFSLRAYERILMDEKFIRAFVISVIRVVLSLVINLVVSVPMAFALTRTSKEFRGRNVYMKLVLFAMLFSGGLIPGYLIVNKLRLINTIWALVLPGAVPLSSVILLMNFFRAMPKSLEEAAFIDGARPWQVLVQIVIPCSKAVLATVSLFSIVGNWNDYFGALVYMTKTKNYPLMTYIQALNASAQELAASGATPDMLADMMEVSAKNLNAAKIVVSVVPLMFIYPFLQKYLITGMIIGAVKE